MKMTEPLRFYSPLKGISFLDIDGKLAVRDLNTGDHLDLARVRDNEYDPHAIRVLRRDGVPVGWIAKEMSPVIAPHIDLGTKFFCLVDTIVKPGKVVTLYIHEADHSKGELPCPSNQAPQRKSSPLTSERR